MKSKFSCSSMISWIICVLLFAALSVGLNTTQYTENSQAPPNTEKMVNSAKPIGLMSEVFVFEKPIVFVKSESTKLYTCSIFDPDAACPSLENTAHIDPGRTGFILLTKSLYVAGNVYVHIDPGRGIQGGVSFLV